MNFPSTNTDGRNPSLGGIVSNVESSHGVLLDGGSAGGIITAVGDDANIPLRIYGKGTGGVTIGSTAVPNSTSAAVASIKAILTSTFAWAHAAISSGQYGEIVLASTTCNAEPGDAVILADFSATTNVTVANMRLSTAATSRVTIVLSNVGSSATSTFSGTGRVTWFDLT
jgi:hypothetical protein